MRRRKRLAALPALAILCVLAIGAAVPDADARATGPQTLSEALAAAYGHNADLLAARARLRGTDEQVPQALAGWRPTVNITGGAGGQGQSTGTSTLLPLPLSYRQWFYGTGLKLDWPVYQGGRTGADVRRAEESVLAARADLLGTEQNVLLEAATAYSEVLRTRRLLALYRELEGVLQRHVRETTIRKEAGQLTQTDVLQAENRLSGARVTRIGAEGDVAAAVARYVAAVGSPPPVQLAGPVPPPGLPADTAAAVRLATENNPTVIASLHRAEAAGHAIGVAHADLLPNVNFTVQGTLDQGQTNPTVWTRAYAASLNLTVPLYQNGGAASRFRQARESASESRVQIWSTQRDAAKNAETAFAQWRAAVDQEAEQHRQVQLAQAAYSNVQREAALGAKSEFELLSQLQELYNARTSEVGASYNTLVRAYQLLVAIGRFTATDLGLPVAIYDASAHYQAARDSDGALVPWLNESGPPPEADIPQPPTIQANEGAPPAAPPRVSGVATQRR